MTTKEKWRGLHKLSELERYLDNDYEWAIFCYKLHELIFASKYTTGRQYLWYTINPPWYNPNASAKNLDYILYVGYPKPTTKQTVVVTSDIPQTYLEGKLLTINQLDQFEFTDDYFAIYFGDILDWLKNRLYQGGLIPKDVISKILFEKFNKRFRELNTPIELQIKLKKEGWILESYINTLAESRFNGYPF